MFVEYNPDYVYYVLMLSLIMCFVGIIFEFRRKKIIDKLFFVYRFYTSDYNTISNLLIENIVRNTKTKNLINSFSFTVDSPFDKFSIKVNCYDYFISWKSETEIHLIFIDKNNLVVETFDSNSKKVNSNFNIYKLSEFTKDKSIKIIISDERSVIM